MFVAMILKQDYYLFICFYIWLFCASFFFIFVSLIANVKGFIVLYDFCSLNIFTIVKKF